MNPPGMIRVEASPRLSIRPGQLSRREWKAWLTVMLTAALESRAPRANVDLFLVRDGEIAALNAEFLGCVGPTNILSFPEEGQSLETDANPDAEAGRVETTRRGGAIRLGALYLSTDALRRECLLYGQDTAEHARRLLAHGLAHLLGHDHGPAMDAVCALLENAAAETPENAAPVRNAELDAARRV